MIVVTNETAMQRFGERLGAKLSGGEVIELVGDVGAGKTTFVRGLARGFGIDETVQSPSFTINRVYDAPNGMRLVHYDFYRLNDAGIMAEELKEMIHDEKTVVVVEWADAVTDVLPKNRLTLKITSTAEDERTVEWEAEGEKSTRLMEGLQ